MIVNLRLEHGLPRGGIGYLGLLLSPASALAAYHLDGLMPLVFACLVCPICLWLGLGLRADGLSGELADETIIEEPHKFDVLRLRDNVVTIFRCSTAIILIGFAAPIIAALRLAGLIVK